jgi:glyoxylase-like metal-dependent hydrolase (beta-lactamase superfamily II)
MRSLLAVLLAIPSVALAQIPDIDFAKATVTSAPIAGNVHMLTGVGGNIGVSVGPDGLLIVDDQFEALAPKINKALDKLSKAKIVYVLNTHWHFDHAGGNAVLGREGHIVAHREVRTRLVTGGDMDIFGVMPAAKKEALPVITYDSSMSIYFNGEEIRLTHLPSGHTDGDTLVHFVGSNVLHMGDHFFVGSFPFVDMKSGGTVEGYLRNIEKVLHTLPQGAKIIPGHGPVAGREELERFVATIRESVALVRAKREAGKTLAQVQAEGLPEKFKPWGAGFITQDIWLKTVFTSLEQGAKKANAGTP